MAGHSYYLKAKDRKEKFKTKVFTLKNGSTNYATLDFKKEKASFSFGGATGVLGLQKSVPKKVVIKKEEVIKEPFESIQERQEIGEIEGSDIEESISDESVILKNKMSEIPKYKSKFSTKKSSLKKNKVGSIFSMSVIGMIFILGGSLFFVAD